MTFLNPAQTHSQPFDCNLGTSLPHLLSSVRPQRQTQNSSILLTFFSPSSSQYLRSPKLGKGQGGALPNKDKPQFTITKQGGWICLGGGGGRVFGLFFSEEQIEKYEQPRLPKKFLWRRAVTPREGNFGEASRRNSDTLFRLKSSPRGASAQTRKIQRYLRWESTVHSTWPEEPGPPG